MQNQLATAAKTLKNREKRTRDNVRQNRKTKEWCDDSRITAMIDTCQWAERRDNRGSAECWTVSYEDINQTLQILASNKELILPPLLVKAPHSPFTDMSRAASCKVLCLNVEIIITCMIIVMMHTYPEIKTGRINLRVEVVVLAGDLNFISTCLHSIHFYI